MSFSDRDGFIWFDGQMVPWRDAKVHVLTHSLHYGLGVFEGVRAYETDRGTAISLLHAHTVRFLRSAHILGMQLPHDPTISIAPYISVLLRLQLSSLSLLALPPYPS